MHREPPLGRTWYWAQLAFCTALVILSALLAIGVLLAALTWLDRPFPGFLVEPNLIVSALRLEGWTGGQVASVEQVVAANGQPLSSPADLWRILAENPVGTPITYEIVVVDGPPVHRVYQVPSSRFSYADLSSLFFLPYCIGLVFLALGAFVYYSRPVTRIGTSFLLFCLTIAWGFILLFDLVSTHVLARLWLAALAAGLGSGLHLALVFPEERRPIRRWPRLRFLPYLPAGLLVVVTQLAYENPAAYLTVARWCYLGAGVAVVALAASVTYAMFRGSSLRVRQQSRIALAGIMAGFGPLATWFLSSALLREANPLDGKYMIPFVVIFPAAIAYSILRHRLFDIRLVVRRGLVYALLTVLLLGAYLLIVGVLSLLFQDLIQANNPVILAAFVLMVAILVNPVRERLQLWVDKTFYRQRYDYRQTLQEFSRALTSLMDLPVLLALIVHRVADTLQLEEACIVLLDANGHEYVARESLYLSPEQMGRLRLPHDGPLAERLRQERQPIYFEFAPLVGLSPVERDHIAQLRVVLLIPLVVKDRLIGWLGLGRKRSDQPYNDEDLELLSTLADQAAVAVENAQLFAERQRRINELATLNHVGRALSASLQVDELLDLVYRQTMQMVNAEHLTLALYDERSRAITFALSYEEGKRQEPVTVPLGPGLISHVISTRQPLLLAEGVPSEFQGSETGTTPRTRARSWLGVPLVVGERVLGALAVHDSERYHAYDAEHQEVLSTIAAQAAIALENARLFEELRQFSQELERRVQRRTEDLAAALLAQEAEALRSQSILESMADGVIVVNTVGEVTLANRAAAQILGRDVPHLTGWDTTLLMEDDDADLCTRLGYLIGSSIVPRPKLRPQRQVLESDSQAIQVHLSPVIAASGEFLGAVAVFRDVSQEMEVNRAKTKFVNEVAHELRAPLTSIKGYVDLILEDEDYTKEEIYEWLKVVQANSNRLSQLIADLLDVSRIEAGKITLKQEPVDLVAVISDVLATFQGQAAAKRLSLSSFVPDDLLWILGDRDRVIQVLNNLVSNAIKYTPDGGQVLVSAQRQQHMVRVDVVDSGIGLSPADQQRLFEKFFRADHPLVRQVAGTGLGLSIAKGIVEMHGGRIWVESEPGAGSMFSFTLPAYSADETPGGI